MHPRHVARRGVPREPGRREVIRRRWGKWCEISLQQPQLRNQDLEDLDIILEHFEEDPNDTLFFNFDGCFFTPMEKEVLHVQHPIDEEVMQDILRQAPDHDSFDDLDIPTSRMDRDSLSHDQRLATNPWHCAHQNRDGKLVLRYSRLFSFESKATAPFEFFYRVIFRRFEVLNSELTHS
jgi:hypothetical protein